MATITANITSSATLIPLSAEVEIGYYTIDSENIYVTGMSRGADGRDFTRLTASVDRAVGGSTAATHTSGATLVRYYPDAKAGTGGGGVTVDNTVDPPAEVVTLVAPGAVIAGDEATLPLSLFSLTVNLTNAQILTMPSTPVELVPPTELNPDFDEPFTTIPMPVSAWFTLDSTGGAFVTDDPFNIGIGWGADDTIFIGLVADEGVPINLASTFGNDIKPQVFRVVSMDRDNIAFNLTDSLMDNGIYLAAQTGNTNMTGGNAANSLKVTIVYYVVTL